MFNFKYFATWSQPNKDIYISLEKFLNSISLKD